MNLTPEQQKEFARFPAPLRALVEAELAAGNAIAAIENGFPAAPCGASIKLAQAVKESRRKSTSRVTFYARNNSSYAGEFTTAERHFFVLEPPLPPPPPPDMDAIRKALEPKPDPLVELAQRRAGSLVHFAVIDSGLSRKHSRRSAPVAKPRAARKAITFTETSTGRTHLLHFQDRRPPHEVQFALERELMTLFAATMEEGRLIWRATANVIGADYGFELRFLAAPPAGSCYSLRVEVSWGDRAPTHHDYFRKTSASWIEMWTRELMPANPPAASRPLTERYRALCQAALQAEAHLDSVAAIQQAVIAGLKRGGRFANSHKEGGTNIYWCVDRFVRSDYGDYPDTRTYTDEAEFLTALRQFCHHEVIRHAGKRPFSEFEIWKLILRRMHSS